MTKVVIEFTRDLRQSKSGIFQFSADKTHFDAPAIFFYGEKLFFNIILTPSGEFGAPFVQN